MDSKGFYKELHNFLEAKGSPTSIRQLILVCDSLNHFKREMPSGNPTPKELTTAFVELLKRHDGIDKSFFEDLKSVLPIHVDEIQKLEERYKAELKSFAQATRNKTDSRRPLSGLILMVLVFGGIFIGVPLIHLYKERIIEFIQEQLVEKEPIDGDNAFLSANIEKRDNRYFAVFESLDEDEIKDDYTALTPLKHNGQADKYSYCNISVFWGETRKETSKGQYLIEIIDFYAEDIRYCPNSLPETVSKKWGVFLNPWDFPGPNIHKARRLNAQADKIIEDGVNSFAQRESDYQLALASLKRAKEIYEIRKEFLRRAPRKVAQKIKDLEYSIGQQMLFINSVSAKPIHEMQFIPSRTVNVWDPGEKSPKNISHGEFWIDRFEVSNHQFQTRYDGKNWIPKGSSNYPTTNITWIEAERYCESLQLRLPTDIEMLSLVQWDNEAKTTRPYPWGDDEDRLAALMSKDFRVVQFDPNSGPKNNILNLIGNVAEWTIRVLYHGTGKYLVMGGSSYDTSLNAFNIRNIRQELNGRFKDVGFRCAASKIPNRDGVLLHPYVYR